MYKIRQRGSAPDAELFDHLGVFVVVFALEVVEQPLALAYEFQKSKSRGVVFFVLFEVLGEIVDPFTQKCDLYRRTSGVVF